MNYSWRCLINGYKKRSKIAKIGVDLDHSVTISEDMATLGASMDSAHRIDRTTSLDDILIVVEDRRLMQRWTSMCTPRMGGLRCVLL